MGAFQARIIISAIAVASVVVTRVFAAGDAPKTAHKEPQNNPPLIDQASCLFLDDENEFFQQLEKAKANPKQPDEKDISRICAQDRHKDKADCRARCEKAYLKGAASAASLSETFLERKNIPESVRNRIKSESVPDDSEMKSCFVEGFTDQRAETESLIREKRPGNCLLDYGEGYRMGQLICQEVEKSDDCTMYNPKVCHAGCYAMGFEKGMSKCWWQSAAKALREEQETSLVSRWMGSTSWGRWLTGRKEKIFMYEQINACEKKANAIGVK